MLKPEPRTDTARFVSEYPTDGRELCQLWDMPAECLQSEMLKIALYVPGTQQTELKDSIVLGSYHMEDVAGTFGPGRYLLKPGPGQYRAKTCTLNISESFARTNGWREMPTLPPPRRERFVSPTDMFIQDRMNQSSQGPISPVDMSTMMELAITKALAAQNASRPQTDPVAPIMSGFELALTMMEKAKGIVNPGAVVEAEPLTLADVALKHAPDILGILKQGLAMFSAAAAGPAPQAPPPVKVVNPAPQAPHQPAPQPAQPEERSMEAPNLLPLPELTQEQVEAVTPILGTLNSFAPTLIQFLESDKTADELGSMLAGMIGPDLEDSAIALSEIVQAHGPNILGIRYPALASEKAAMVVHVTAAKIKAER